jgi:alpha-L-fucosidase
VWLSINGEAVYGARPWVAFGEGPHLAPPSNPSEFLTPPFTAQDVRFTTKGDILYAIVMAWPAGGRATITALGRASGLTGGEITSIRLLGHPDPLTWNRTDAALTVDFPADPPCNHAFALEILGLAWDRTTARAAPPRD